MAEIDEQNAGYKKKPRFSKRSVIILSTMVVAGSCALGIGFGVRNHLMQQSQNVASAAVLDAKNPVQDGSNDGTPTTSSDPAAVTVAPRDRPARVQSALSGNAVTDSETVQSSQSETGALTPKPASTAPSLAGDFNTTHSSSFAKSVSLATPNPIAWNPLDRNAAPVTEITLLSCTSISDPFCHPESTDAEILARGEWSMVERDLNERIGSDSLFLFERRLLPGSDLPVVTKIKLLTHAPTGNDLPVGNGQWMEVAKNLRSGLKDSPQLDRMTMHYLLTPQSELAAAHLQAVTEFDVIYGDSHAIALPGFTKVKGMITGGFDDTSSSRIGSALAVRRTLPDIVPTPKLQFRSGGDFKILQLADLHFSTGRGVCKSLSGQEQTDCETRGADQYSAHWLARAIKETRPDMIVMTGDQSEGGDASWSTQTAIMKWASIVIETKLPWTAIFGNHDSTGGSSRAEQMQLMESMPYFVGEAVPSSVAGVGNYVRSIYSGDSNNAAVFNLYFLDSHGNKKPSGYDTLARNQVDWYRAESDKVQPIQRPYGAASGSQAKPNAITFVHIPLVEMNESPADIGRSGKPLTIGKVLGSNGGSDDNSGFLKYGILHQREKSEKSSPPETKLMVYGHCHITDECRRVRGVWMCFGGGTSFSAFGDRATGFERRVSMYKLSQYGETIETWKHTPSGQRETYLKLAGKGATA